MLLGLGGGVSLHRHPPPLLVTPRNSPGRLEKKPSKMTKLFTWGGLGRKVGGEGLLCLPPPPGQSRG